MTYSFTISRPQMDETDFVTDDEAVRLLEELGYSNTGAGTNLVTMQRDLDFQSEVLLTAGVIASIKLALLNNTGVEFELEPWNTNQEGEE